MANPDQNARRADGRYIPTQAAADRAAEAARLKAANPRMTYQEIADAVGYSHKKNAWAAVQRCRETVIRDAGADLVVAEADHLDDLFVAALEVMERDHPLVSNGEIVHGPDGEPLDDPRPKLAAIKELRQIRESYRRLYGIDQPTKTQVTGGTTTLAELLAATKPTTDDADAG